MCYVYNCFLTPSAAYDIETIGLLLTERNNYETAATGNFIYMEINIYISDSMPPLNNLPPIAIASIAFPEIRPWGQTVGKVIT